MSRRAGVQVFPIDIGMARKTKVPDYKVAYGTKNMARGPAMTREEALQAVMTGIRLVKEKKEAGVQLLATGEMGIGNTTTSSAVSTLLLGEMPERMTGTPMPATPGILSETSPMSAFTSINSSGVTR